MQKTKDFLWYHLRELPYFRSLLRAVEAGFYDLDDLPSPVLDLGCGDGHFGSIIFDERPIEVGIDPEAKLLRQAARRGSYRLLVQADGGRLPFPDGYFASAFSNSVLEHIPEIEQVLREVYRVLQTGARLVFSVPNPGYLSELSIANLLEKLRFRRLASLYTNWFRRMSRVYHADTQEKWQLRLENAGFMLERWWNYFPPAAMRTLEWGHFFGAPTLIPHALTGRWILAPARWNLFLTERLVRPYAQSLPYPEGTFTFYIAVKM